MNACLPLLCHATFSSLFSRPARHFAPVCATVLTALLGTQSAHAALPIEHWRQSNGAQIYFIASPSIPMVDVRIDFDAGSRRDPSLQAGLASVTAGMVSKGIAARDGEPALDENALGQAWADLGADFGIEAGTERMSFSLRSLTEPSLLQKAAALAARQMGEPAFDATVWQREHQRINAAIREARTRPGTIAGIAYAKAVYGNHPYGNEITEQTLAAIHVRDMRDFYQGSIHACAAKVSIVGALQREQADALAAQLLSRLPHSTCEQALPAVPAIEPLKAAKDIRIPFDSAQAHVLIGQPGYPRNDPDFFPLAVGNYILGGGGFVSRLMSEVRQKRGLTYGIYSEFAYGLDAGAFTVSLQTRPDQAEQALQTSKEVIRQFVEQGPTDEELQAAKDYLMGSFALRIDSNAKLLGNVANIAWYDLPLNYLDTWTGQIQTVTAGQVRGAFQRVLQPARMVTVVVGENKP